MPYTAVHVFGDSLVDAGNALKLANWYSNLTSSDLPDGAPTAELGYFQGRFTNGYNFADLVSNKLIGVATKPVFPYGYEDPWLGIPVAPFASDPSGNNLNWAYGGAQIIRGDEAVPDLDGQTDAFKDGVDDRADPGALHMFTFGGNDVRSLVPSGRDPTPRDEAYAELRSSATKMQTELTQIFNVGARQFLITGMADVGLIPSYDRDDNNRLEGAELTRSAAATDYSKYLDALIRNEVVPALQKLGATVTYLPLIDYTDASGRLVTGALNANLPTIAAAQGLTAEELKRNLLLHQDLLFFDSIHPNGQAHALLGAQMYARHSGTAWVETLPLTAAAADFRASSSIGVVGEVDKWTVATIAGTSYTLEVLGMSSLGTSGSLADSAIRLLNASAVQVAADDDSGAGFDATVTFSAVATGNHSLEIRGAGAMTGSYTLQGAVVSGTATTAGNLYTVTSATTMVIEGAGGIGRDIVKASVSYALGGGAEIEELRTTNDRGKTDIDLVGNEFGQLIVGNLGANRIDGGGGDDVLTGGKGVDRLIGGAGADSFLDVVAGLSGDTIEDLRVGDRIVLRDAKLAGFTVSLSGTTLTFTGGSLILANAPAGTIVARAAAEGGVEMVLRRPEAQNDFNGDGRSDILWRHDNGTVGNWLGTASGAFFINEASTVGVADTGWKIVGTGDFNGDGRDDVLWRHTNGTLIDWLSTASATYTDNSASFRTEVPTSREVAGIGDFNGDRREDILWRDEGGVLSSWIGTASGGFTVNSSFTARAPASWAIVGTGDFNGDGLSDLLWRSANGAIKNWLGTASGGLAANEPSLVEITTSWQLVGTGDFNGDGRDDLLMRSGSGTLTNWLGTAGGSFSSNAANSTSEVATSWHVADVGDYNGDGRDDVLWRHDSGGTTNWLGTASGGFIGNDVNFIADVPLVWQIQSPDSLWL